LSCGNCDDEPGRKPAGYGSHHGGPIAWVRAFWIRAYRENVTGLSGMVAYNLLLSIFPFSLLVLFVFSQVLRIDGIETGVLSDLQRLFPDAGDETLRDILASIRSNSATIGVIAIVASLWIGASFWGAMDTAFCRIYHVQCRGWWEQKRFSLAMLVVVSLFILGTVILPAVEGALIRSTEGLPLGLNEVQNLDDVILVSITLTLNFIVCSVIYWLVPKGHMPWSAVWPGAVFATLISGLANWLFPFYLENVTTLNRFGTTAAFVLIALVWFYIVAITILAGAVINSLRHEYRDTGMMPYAIDPDRQTETRDPGRHVPMAEPYRSLSGTGRDRPGEDPAPAADEIPDEPVTAGTPARHDRT
jgi:membrane protein